MEALAAMEAGATQEAMARITTRTAMAMEALTAMEAGAAREAMTRTTTRTTMEALAAQTMAEHLTGKMTLTASVSGKEIGSALQQSKKQNNNY